MSSVPMIVRCYYRQHPECYGRPEVEEAPLPAEMLGQGSAPASGEVIAEETMGNPEAVPV